MLVKFRKIKDISKCQNGYISTIFLYAGNIDYTMIFYCASINMAQTIIQTSIKKNESIVKKSFLLRR